MVRKPRYQRSKVSHLYLHTKHGVYYVRGRDAHGTDTWRSLSTKSFEIARAAILRSWLALAQLPPAKVTEDDCLQWAKAYQKTVSAGRFNNTVGTSGTIGPNHAADARFIGSLFK
jgi:hypothetical protein